MKFTEIVKDIMNKQKLSQVALAKLIKVNQTTVSQWLMGKKKPSFDNILAFYEHFGITPNEIFGVEDYFLSH